MMRNPKTPVFIASLLALLTWGIITPAGHAHAPGYQPWQQPTVLQQILGAQSQAGYGRPSAYQRCRTAHRPHRGKHWRKHHPHAHYSYPARMARGW